MGIDLRLTMHQPVIYTTALHCTQMEADATIILKEPLKYFN